jgi:alcohol dehydrogenase
MMVFAEYLAGIAFNNASLGYVHALAHQLGGMYNLPHGLANAIMLPYVVEYNRHAAGQKYAEIAHALGQDIRDVPIESAAQMGVAAIKDLVNDLGIPKTLSEIRGFNANDIPILAANALKDICCLTNPRQGSQQDIEDIFRSAI